MCINWIIKHEIKHLGGINFLYMERKKLDGMGFKKKEGWARKFL